MCYLLNVPVVLRVRTRCSAKIVDGTYVISVLLKHKIYSLGTCPVFKKIRVSNKSKRGKQKE